MLAVIMTIVVIDIACHHCICLLFSSSSLCVCACRRRLHSSAVSLLGLMWIISLVSALSVFHMCHHNYLTYASALCNSCCHTVRVRPAIVVSYPGHFIEYFNVINRMFSLLHLCYSLSHRVAADMHFVIAARS